MIIEDMKYDLLAKVNDRLVKIGTVTVPLDVTYADGEVTVQVRAPQRRPMAVEGVTPTWR